MINNDLSQQFLKLAYQHAKLFSPDPRTKNGAILVEPNSLKIIAQGVNRFPDGIKNLPDRLQPEKKYHYLEHAERDAIFSAAKKGVSTLGAVLYVPWFACVDCAKAIIGAGIKQVIGHKDPCHTSTAWTSNIEAGLALLKEANVEYHYYDGKVGVDDLLFCGQVVNR